MRIVSVLASAALVASCGGGDSSRPGSATFTGTVAGNSFTPRDAISSIGSFTNGNGVVAGKGAFITISSAASLCSDRTGGKARRSTQYLQLAVFKVQPDFTAAALPSPGVYQVGALPIENAVSQFVTTDAICGLPPANIVGASTGTITLTAVGSRYTGSYDMLLESGDPVRGTFDAPLCDAGSGTPICE